MKTRPCRRQVSVALRRMAGLSLIELMVAVALGLLILAGLITVFVNASAARNEVERTSRQIENGRYAVEILSDDIRLAGFYGGLSPVAAVPAIAVPGALPDPCAIPASVDEWMQPLHLHVQGYAAPNATTAPDLTATTCAPANLKPGSDVLVVRRVRTCAAGTTGCDLVAGGPYFQYSRCATESPTTTHKLGLEGTETFDLTLKNCTTPAPLYQYYINIYFVSTDNTLKRLEFTGVGAPTETALVEGIEYFKVEYGIDNDGDGLPDAYASDAATVAGWMNVVTARFFVLARNLDASPGYTDSKTYTLGTTTVGPFNNGYRRHVYGSLVRMVNPAGLRDTP